jgi:hypothetical protein
MTTTRASNKRRKDNTHRVLWYLQEKSSDKHPEWRSSVIALLFGLYEARRENPGLFLWIRAVDGISIYCGDCHIADFQLAKKHALINAPKKSPFLTEGDIRFGKNARHKGSGYRQWKVDARAQVDAFLDFLNQLPRILPEERPTSRNIPQAVREEVYERDNGKCCECGSTTNLHFDHILPFSKNGNSTASNIRLLCAKHNLEQGASMKY